MILEAESPNCNIFMEVKTMKELYFEAEMDIVEFCAEDVVTTSGPNSQSTTSKQGGLGGENEGPAGDSFL